MIFVHGGFGSGGQFESQAMRFATNGYPDSHLAALEYDSTFGLQSFDDVLASLEELVAELQASTGAEQVDLMGHSLGTRVSQMYLPARAAATSPTTSTSTAARPTRRREASTPWRSGRGPERRAAGSWARRT